MRDEAADTPLWMPLLGLCLLVLGAFAVIWQAANAQDEASAPAEAAAPAEAEAAAGQANAEPEPAAADEHAGHDH